MDGLKKLLLNTLFIVYSASALQPEPLEKTSFTTLIKRAAKTTKNNVKRFVGNNQRVAGGCSLCAASITAIALWLLWKQPNTGHSVPNILPLNEHIDPNLNHQHLMLLNSSTPNDLQAHSTVSQPSASPVQENLINLEDISLHTDQPPSFPCSPIKPLDDSQDVSAAPADRSQEKNKLNSANNKKYLQRLTALLQGGELENEELIDEELNVLLQSTTNPEVPALTQSTIAAAPLPSPISQSKLNAVEQMPHEEVEEDSAVTQSMIARAPLPPAISASTDEYSETEQPNSVNKQIQQITLKHVDADQLREERQKEIEAKRGSDHPLHTWCTNNSKNLNYSILENSNLDDSLFGPEDKSVIVQQQPLPAPVVQPKPRNKIIIVARPKSLPERLNKEIIQGFEFKNHIDRDKLDKERKERMRRENLNNPLLRIVPDVVSPQEDNAEQSPVITESSSNQNNTQKNSIVITTKNTITDDLLVQDTGPSNDSGKNDLINSFIEI